MYSATLQVKVDSSSIIRLTSYFINACHIITEDDKCTTCRSRSDLQISLACGKLVTRLQLAETYLAIILSKHIDGVAVARHCAVADQQIVVINRISVLKGQGDSNFPCTFQDNTRVSGNLLALNGILYHLVAITTDGCCIGINTCQIEGFRISEGGLASRTDSNCGGFTVIALDDSLYKVFLIELRHAAMTAVGESHPVEGAKALLLCLLHEILGKGKHVGVLIGIVDLLLIVRNAPLTEDDGCTLRGEIGLYSGHHLVDAALGTAQSVVKTGIAVNLEDDMTGGIIRRQCHLCQRILQVGVPFAHATAGSIGIDDEVAHGIITTRSTHGADETLCVAVDGVIC